MDFANMPDGLVLIIFAVVVFIVVGIPLIEFLRDIWNTITSPSRMLEVLSRFVLVGVSFLIGFVINPVLGFVVGFIVFFSVFFRGGKHRAIDLDEGGSTYILGSLYQYLRRPYVNIKKILLVLIVFGMIFGFFYGVSLLQGS